MQGKVRRQINIRVCLSLMLLGCGFNVWGQQNAKQIALSRWYDVNQSVTFALPDYSSPSAIAFDGENIWAASGENGVTKIRANDGETLGTFTVGSGPRGFAFDGVNIWVANWNDSTLTKLVASSGELVGTYRVPNGTKALVFDGSCIWTPSGQYVTKIDAKTGEIVGTYPLGESGGAENIAFDGANVWVTGDSLVKIDPHTGLVVASYPIPAHAITTEGANLWLGNQTEVLKVSGTTGRVLSRFAADRPECLVFDGVNVWWSSSDSNTVTKVVASTDHIVGSYPTGMSPWGLVFDGANLWVATASVSASAALRKM